MIRTPDRNELKELYEAIEKNSQADLEKLAKFWFESGQFLKTCGEALSSNVEEEVNLERTYVINKYMSSIVIFPGTIEEYGNIMKGNFTYAGDPKKPEGITLHAQIDDGDIKILWHNISCDRIIERMLARQVYGLAGAELYLPLDSHLRFASVQNLSIITQDKAKVQGKFVKLSSKLPFGHKDRKETSEYLASLD